MMKSVMIAAAAIFGFAGTAMAFELGQTGVFLDNTTTAAYSVEAGEFTASHEFNLNYDLSDKATVYALTEVDLGNPEFAGLEVGIDYRVWSQNANEVNLNGRVLTDANFNYTDAIVELEIKF